MAFVNYTISHFKTESNFLVATEHRVAQWDTYQNSIHGGDNNWFDLHHNSRVHRYIPKPLSPAGCFTPFVPLTDGNQSSVGFVLLRLALHHLLPLPPPLSLSCLCQDLRLPALPSPAVARLWLQYRWGWRSEAGSVLWLCTGAHSGSDMSCSQSGTLCYNTHSIHDCSTVKGVINCIHAYTKH